MNRTLRGGPMGMWRVLSVILIIIFIPLGCSKRKDLGPNNEVRNLLPVGELSVDVLQLEVSLRLGELASRYQQAIEKDPVWWSQYMNSARRGEPLLYTPKMGISEAEYRELMRLSNTAVLREVGRSRLVVTEQMRDILSFIGGVDFPELSKVEIDLEKDVVRTPYGMATGRRKIEANDKQRATGPWDGIQWEYVEHGSLGKTSVLMTFAIGKLKQSGRGLLYYEAKRIQNENAIDNVMYVLKYDLPGK
jgi:hypothetical protein